MKAIRFGSYYLLDRVNVGGMAEVFRAKAVGLEGFERLLAVKRILPGIAADKEFIEMFIDEAKIAVQLTHGNICQVFNLGKVDESYFIALEFVHGKDLRAIFDRLRAELPGGDSAMPLGQACFIIMRACDGLDYAHNKRDDKGRELNLVHRDVSPQNILISYEGEVKLIDFGIAQATGKASKTQQGILKGKFGYMSPEQVRGLPLDRRSDVFSLGIVLYELVTGERLFVSESDFSTLEKVRNVEIRPPSAYNRRVTPELERIVLKALAKDADDRYQSAMELHDELQSFVYRSGTLCTTKDLAAWMQRIFAAEIEAENVKLESYRHLPPPLEREPAAVPAPAPERARRSSGAFSVAGPPVRLPAPARVGAQRPAGLKWDEEELETNVYEPSQQLAIVADGSRYELTDPDLPGIELDAEGGPVLYDAEVEDVLESDDDEPVVGAEPNQPSKPFGLAPLSSSSPTPVVVPAAWQVQRRPLPRVYWMAALVAVCAGVAWLILGRKPEPGQMVIASQPASGVQLLVDNKRQPVDHTPATLNLEPGSYLLTLQREGYVPWNEQVELKAGQRLSRRVALEPLASDTGFSLTSQPPGAKVWLDGRLLEGATPLKMVGLQAGTHRLEARSPNGSWAQEVAIETGRVSELAATLAPAQEASAEPPLPEKPPAAAPPTTGPAPPAAEPKLAAAAPEPPPRPSDQAAATKADQPAPKSAAARGSRRAATRLQERTSPSERTSLAAMPPAGERGPGEGYLRLGSKPWTMITIDGKETGLYTPQTRLKLPAGLHRVTLSNPKFNIRESFSVQVKPGETETVTKKFIASPVEPD